MHSVSILLLCITCVQGQFWVLNDGLLNNSIVRYLSTYAGETFTNFIGLTSNGPITVARNLGLTGSFPPIVYRNNMETNVLTDFKAGLKNEDAELNIKQLGNKYGYQMEEHSVTTTDGYVLKLHRIPRNNSVVFLMHGLLGSSDDYVIAGPDSGLAYLLFKAGYDVWFGNARGNKHSRKHKHLNPSSPKFWDFSWHEIGVYDLPAFIDYVLKHTNKSKLKYIGHSQGTTAFFVMASEKPEYNAKISLMVALSPVAWMSNVRSPMVRMLAPGGPFINVITSALGVHEFLPDNGLLRALRTVSCSVVPLAELFCSNVLFLSVGFDFDQLNVTNLPVIFGHSPAGAAVKQFAHYGQGVISESFRQFDYGTRRNRKKYGFQTPPSYKVELISCPVSLFYSDEDWLAHPKDVNKLYKKLSNVVDLYKIPKNRFNHVDYLWANDVKTLIFQKLISLMQKF